MAKGRLTWRKREVMLVVKNATAAGMDRLALRVESEAKQNIVANDQVDTGFMLNTVYHVSRLSNSYPATDAPGTKTGRKSGQQREVDKAPQATLPAKYLALVAVGAEYAIYQELQRSFLYLALVQVAGDAGAIQGSFADIVR